MKNVDDIYPVSPMQDAMLLHTVTHAGVDALFNQFCYSIDANVDVSAFQRAWQQTLDRHAALRTGFVWEKVKRPLQVVRKELTLPLEALDWRGRTATQHEQDLAAWCDEDRRRGFDPRRPPLMRLALMQRTDASWFFVWSSHHLLLDRWCLGTIHGDFDRFYAAQTAGRPLAPDRSPAFRDYIQWLQEQDPARAESFWRLSLKGIRKATFAAPGGKRGRGTATAEELRVDARTLRAMRRLARARGVTLSTVVQAGWALTLNRLTGSQDIIFGAAVSGRPPEVANVESIVGSFVNNVPVRVQLPAEQSICALLTSMQTAQHRRSQYEYVSPVELHRYSDLPHGQPLFDSLLVWLAPEDSAPSRPLPMRGISSDFTTAYPFTLSVAETATALTLHGQLQTDSATSAQELLGTLHSILGAIMAADETARIASIGGFRYDPGFSVVDLDSKCTVPGNAPPAGDADEASVQSGREAISSDVLTDFLRAEWQQVLASDEIAVDDDFFALGGDSIRAAQLHSRIEAGTRQTVPILTLFQKSSLRQMADTLARGDWDVKPNIAICLREHGEGRPLFCVASAEVNTVGYSLLMRHLGDRRKVYVLQAPPDSDRLRRMHPNELPALATRYVRAMQEVQPTGPYHLLGMCGGAHIAVEMTRALEAENQRASFLGIVNTWGFYTVSRLFYLNRFMNIARYYVGRVKRLLASVGARPPPNNAPQPDTTKSAPAPLQALQADDEIGLDNPWIRDVGFAYRNPRRPRIASTITVFRIQPQQYWRIRDAGLGWSKQSADVRIVALAGTDHNSILREPFVRDIAQELDKLLQREPQPGTVRFHPEAITQTGSAL